MSARPTFSSGLTALLTMAGLAIGLGNVWRFPYMMGQNGGSAFLLVYLLFMLLLAVPALMAEWSLGRETRTGPIETYRKVIGTRTGLAIGLIMVFSVFMALTYYSLVIGHIVYTAWFAAASGFDAGHLPAYHDGMSRHGLQFLLGAGVTVFSLWIVHRGLHRGIEVMNRWLVPLFGIAVIYLVFVALSLDGAMDRLVAFLQPDFSQITPNVIFAAMGQVCFSVGLSGVLGVMYGSYLQRNQRLAPTAVGTVAMDAGAAFLASLFVVPAVLVFGLNIASGPGLLFDTLPQLFAVMPGGRWLATVFLSAWVMVAVLSVIATYDAIVGGLHDLSGPRIGKTWWIALIGGANVAVMLPIAFNPQWIGTLDLVVGSGMFMFGALIAVLAAGWGLGKVRLAAQVSDGIPARLRGLFIIWLRYLVPLALAAILIGIIYPAFRA